MPETFKELATLYKRVTSRWDKAGTAFLLMVILCDLVTMAGSPSWDHLFSMLSWMVGAALFLVVFYLHGLIQHGVLKEDHGVARALIEKGKKS